METEEQKITDIHEYQNKINNVSDNEQNQRVIQNTHRSNNPNIDSKDNIETMEQPVFGIQALANVFMKNKFIMNLKEKIEEKRILKQKLDKQNKKKFQKSEPILMQGNNKIPLNIYKNKVTSLNYIDDSNESSENISNDSPKKDTMKLNVLQNLEKGLGKLMGKFNKNGSDSLEPNVLLNSSRNFKLNKETTTMNVENTKSKDFAPLDYPNTKCDPKDNKKTIGDMTNMKVSQLKILSKQRQLSAKNINEDIIDLPKRQLKDNIFTRKIESAKIGKLTKDGCSSPDYSEFVDIKIGQEKNLGNEMSNLNYSSGKRMSMLKNNCGISEITSHLKSRNFIEIKNNDNFSINIGFLKTICNLEKNESTTKFFENLSKQNLDYYMKTTNDEKEKLLKIIAKLDLFMQNTNKHSNLIQSTPERNSSNYKSQPLLRDHFQKYTMHDDFPLKHHKITSQINNFSSKINNLHTINAQKCFRNNNSSCADRQIHNMGSMQNSDIKDSSSLAKDYVYYVNETNLNTPSASSPILVRNESASKSRTNDRVGNIFNFVPNYRKENSKYYFFEKNCDSNHQDMLTPSNYHNNEGLNNLPQISNRKSSILRKSNIGDNSIDKKGSANLKKNIIKKVLGQNSISSKYQNNNVNKIVTANIRKLQTALKNGEHSRSRKINYSKVNQDHHNEAYFMLPKNARINSGFLRNDVSKSYVENQNFVKNDTNLENKEIHKIDLDNILEYKVQKKK